VFSGVANIIVIVLGGLALFLFGLELLTGALRSVAGERMRELLASLTTNRFKAAIVGAGTTAVIQSSSVTTVLVVGLVSAGLLSLSQSIGIILGAHVGTTVTAQLVAFKVTKAAFLFIIVGFSMRFSAQRERTREIGTLLLGLGLIFLGMNLMGDAAKPLKDWEGFRSFAAGLDNPIAGIALGTVVTGILQSSSSTTGVVVVMASHGLLSLEAGIALTLGANLGTCVTALLAAIGQSIEAKRTAAAHVVTNFAGVLIWAGLIGVLSELAVSISPPGDVARQIANAHTLFNVANTILFLGFTTQIANFLERGMPDRDFGIDEVAKHLNLGLLNAPGLALEQARRELIRLGKKVTRMVEQAPEAVMSGDREELSELGRKDDEVDRLYEAIVTYLARLSRSELSEADSRRLRYWMAVANYLESAGDTVETHLVSLGRERISKSIRVSAKTRKTIEAFAGEVTRAFKDALKAFENGDEGLGKEVRSRKADLRSMREETAAHLLQRLGAKDEPGRVAAMGLESDIVDQLHRLFYFARRIAKFADRRR
jgi:phosphate:Na+ symporter